MLVHKVTYEEGMIIIVEINKKKRFLCCYRSKVTLNGTLGEQEMLWEQKPLVDFFHSFFSLFLFSNSQLSTRHPIRVQSHLKFLKV